MIIVLNNHSIITFYSTRDSSVVGVPWRRFSHRRGRQDTTFHLAAPSASSTSVPRRCPGQTHSICRLLQVLIIHLICLWVFHSSNTNATVQLAEIRVQLNMACTNTAYHVHIGFLRVTGGRSCWWHLSRGRQWRGTIASLPPLPFAWPPSFREAWPLRHSLFILETQSPLVRTNNEIYTYVFTMYIVLFF